MAASLQRPRCLQEDEWDDTNGCIESWGECVEWDEESWMAYSVARGIGFGDTEGLGVQWVVEFVVEGVDKVVLLQEHACSWPAADRGRQYATPLPGVELFDKSDAEVDVGVCVAVLPWTPPAGSGHYVTVVDLAPVGFDPLGGWLRWWQSFGIRVGAGVYCGWGG